VIGTLDEGTRSAVMRLPDGAALDAIMKGRPVDHGGTVP
jgi:hypothetical protein